MRLVRPLILSLSLLSGYTFAEDSAPRAKHSYQSDVSRLRKIVINSLYSHKEIFLRELISNANDALEKLRITNLKDRDLWDGSELNITLKAIPGNDGSPDQIIITDTGIGMSPEELTTNLGTLAKSGTSEFVSKVEDQAAGGGNGNLIGAFGLGFYSSFLVADRVQVASLPPKSKKNPNPQQYVFNSAADENSFEIFPDPRGNTLGRGTEITLFLKPDAKEYLDTVTLAKLVAKHSGHSSSFPLYLYEKVTEEVVDEEAQTAAEVANASESPETSDKEKDEEEAVVEEVKEEESKPETPPPMKKVTKEKWTHLNAQPPIWTREPKDVENIEYELFYNGYFKDFDKPLAWSHFSGNAGDGTAFKAILYLPSKLPEQFWQKPLEFKPDSVKVLVKRTFITSDLGDHALPKWASWVKVVVDAEDLPLNVSRETLQSNRFLKQLRGIILKRLIQLFAKLKEEDPEKWEKVHGLYGGVIKLGAIEDAKNRDKLTRLAQFTTSQRNGTSFDSYLANKKKGQSQIFYIAEAGKSPEELAESVFVEKLIARGYEVLLLTEPLDEIFIGTIKTYKNVPFQDVAKAGLKFGDEDVEAEEEKAQEKAIAEKFKPLIDWLKVESKDLVKDVVISNRLVTSPCAIVAENFGYTANVQRMLASSNAHRGDILHEYAMKAKVLEINPRSPLVEGLLKRINDLPTDEDEQDPESEAELKEVASILIDGALVRSGFEVTNKNQFFTRVDRVLRRSLGVSESAKADATVKPAPPVDPSLPEEEPAATPIASPKATPEPVVAEDGKPGIILPDHLKDKVSVEMEEIDDDGNVVISHDEL